MYPWLWPQSWLRPCPFGITYRFLEGWHLTLSATQKSPRHSFLELSFKKSNLPQSESSGGFGRKKSFCLPHGIFTIGQCQDFDVSSPGLLCLHVRSSTSLCAASLASLNRAILLLGTKAHIPEGWLPGIQGRQTGFVGGRRPWVYWG